MTWSEICNDYLPSGTEYRITDMLPQSWLWEPPSPPPEMWDTPPRRILVAPHIPMRYFKAFTGHKFRLGGNKA